MAKTLPLLLAVLLLGHAPEASAWSLSDIDFVIKAGHHYDSNFGYGLRRLQFKTRVDRTLRFQVRFPSSTDYRTVDPVNQYDWNKVMGFTTLRIHHNSIRLGWRFVPQTLQMELGFYGYIRGQRISRALTRVDLGTWTEVSIRIHRDGLVVEAGGVRHEENQSLGFSRWFPTLTFVMKSAYFGGDERAPRRMTIEVRNISGR